MLSLFLILGHVIAARYSRKTKREYGIDFYRNRGLKRTSMLNSFFFNSNASESKIID